MKLILGSGALVLGVFLGANLDPPVLPFLLCSAALIPLAILARGQGMSLHLVLLAIFLLGMGRGALEGPETQADRLVEYQGKGENQLEGTIIDYPQPRDAFTQFSFQVERLKVGDSWQKVSGKVLARARPSADMASLREPPYFRYGDHLRLTGTLTEPLRLDGFDWRERLAREGIHLLILRPQVQLLGSGQGSPPLSFIYNLREDMASGLGKGLPEPQASLSQALLLGIRGIMPSELREDLAKTGTTHIVAISGLHIGILVGLVSLTALQLFGRKWRVYLLAPLLFVWGYALLAGFAPPVVRAAIMGSIYLWAIYLGRQQSGLVALAAAAAIMTAISPGGLGEVSFQLSFLAMAGLILLAPWFQALGHRPLTRIWKSQGRGLALAQYLVDAVAISLAAILATLPVIAFNFHIIPVVGLPATIVILLVLPPMLITSLLVALFGLVSDSLAQGLGWLAWPWLSYMLGVVEVFSWVPALTVDIGATAPPLAFAYYGVATLLLWVAHSRWRGFLISSEPGLLTAGQPSAGAGPGGIPFPWRWGFALLAIPPLVFLSVFLAQPSDRLRVTFLDVGQGDAILVQTPSHKTVLIDGGPSPGTLALELGQRLNFWEREVDLVILTHPDSDHLSGLMALVGRYGVGAVVQCGVDCITPSSQNDFSAWDAAMIQNEIQRLDAEKGMVIKFNDGPVMAVLNPPPDPLTGTESDSNNNSVVLRLTYGEVSFLLPGDIEAFGEGYLVRNSESLTSTVLKIAHHGSRTSTTPHFLETVDPFYAVISVGADNPYGHPHPQTLATLRKALPGERILLTSEHGSITFETDGRRLWLKTEK